MSKPPAVVVGLDNITGLQTARILAARGVPVTAIAQDRRHFCCRTSVCRRIVAAETSGEGLVRALEAVGPTLREPAALVPVTDLSVLTISRHRERLAPWYRIALPDAAVVEMLMDKFRFLEYAVAHGLPVPATSIMRSRADAERAAEEMTYPCVVKPPIKTTRWQRQTREKAFLVADKDELLALYARVSGWADLLIAQQWVEGPESSLYSCNCYFDADATPLVTFVARKLRQWPPRTGTSCLGEEVRNDEVLAATVDLFRGVRYHGLGYVEMKRDAHTGRHFIIEPNIGRPTGRSAIAEAGGVELLYAAYADMLGLPLPASLEQRYVGAKWIYFRHDLQSSLHYLSRGELTIGEWWRSIRGRKVDAVFSRSDLKPFVADVVRASGMLLRGLADRVGRTITRA